MELFMEDYREVDGYMHPFVTRMLTRGMMQAADLDQAEIEAQLAQLRAQLDQIPEAQRAMVEGMLNAQIERLESMAQLRGWEHGDDHHREGNPGQRWGLGASPGNGARPVSRTGIHGEPDGLVPDELPVRPF